MKKTIATLAALACLALAPVAPAASGDNFSFAEQTDPDSGTSAPAFPAGPDARAWWAGVCDLLAADFTGPGAVGTDPGYPFPNCIDHPPGWLSGNPGGYPTGQLQPPLAPGVAASDDNEGAVASSGPDGWRRQGSGATGGPEWRLADATQAGARLDGSASFWFSRDPLYSNFNSNARGGSDGAPRSVRVSIPPGVIGNPNAVPKCTSAQLAVAPTNCPPQSQVGISTISLSGLTGVFPVYNAEPRKGKTAELIISGAGGGGAYVTNAPVVASVRSDGDFGVDAFAGEIPTAVAVHSQTFTVWGVPWAKSHDRYRPVANYCHRGATDPFFTNAWVTTGFSIQGLSGGFTGACDQNPVTYHPSWGPIKPFFSTQTECPASNAATRIEATNYSTPVVARADSPVPDITSCEDLEFPADITLDPTTITADSPSGLEVELTIPQNNEPPPAVSLNPCEEVGPGCPSAGAPAHWKTTAGLAVAHLKDTVVTLPEGFAINPSAANGQQVCSSAQIGLTSPIGATPITFNNDDPHDGKGQECPEAAKVAEVVVETPLLDESDWPEGNVYLAAQNDNPFGSNYAIYIVLRSVERGLVVKLAGKVEPDPVTGELRTTFADNPQVPFDRFSLQFKGGSTAPLASSPICGTGQNHTTLSPYSDPNNPNVIDEDVAVTQAPDGGACATTLAGRPFNLGFEAGSTELIAGAHSPFTARFQRPDGNQEFDRIELTTPEGLVAKLAGIPYCSEAGIAAAIARRASGDGRAEQSSPSCPAASQVGTTTIGVGAGLTPFYASGKVYLSGPYKGAPVSLAFIVPAVAGPFDLGVQVVRTALQVNPKTAQVTAVSDTIPKILEGVPLRIRDIRVDIDRPGFTLNPTDCSAQAVSGQVFGASGAVKNVSNHFQVAECAQLPFKPKFTFKLRGGTKRGRYPQFTAIVNARPGDANIASVSAALPRSEFLANEHIRTICTRPDFAADNCPAAAIYGWATAWSPLLDEPLTGPVYLRSSSNLLPDLVPDLRGPAHQPIKVELAGRTDSINGGIRNTFDIVPDAPVSRFVLRMQGGNKGLLVNSRDICRRTYRAKINLTAQNGRTLVLKPKMQAQCKKGKKGKRQGHKRGR